MFENWQGCTAEEERMERRRREEEEEEEEGERERERERERVRANGDNRWIRISSSWRSIGESHVEGS
jgi:hypothetical protein